MPIRIPGPAPHLGALATDVGGDADPSPPVVFVHGVIDNVRRWAHPVAGMNETENPFPVFEPTSPRTGVSPTTKLDLRLLEVLEGSRMRGLAFSYQVTAVGGRTIAPLGEATDMLKAMVSTACERFGVDSVVIVAHSRGGLVTRAVLEDAPTRRRVRKVITLATPHMGSEVAHAGRRILDGAASFLDAFMAKLPLDALTELRLLVDGFANLAPLSEEIRQIGRIGFPDLPRGWAAAAGTEAAYLRISMPPFGRISIPGALTRFAPTNLAEFRDGEGDMVVSVTSALAVPSETPTARFPGNHLTLCHRADTAAWVIDQVRAAR